MRITKLRTLSIVHVLAILIIFGCEDFNPIQKKPFSLIETINPQTDPRLSKLLGDLYNSNENPAGRSLSTNFGEIGLSEALKLNDTINNRTRYTLTLKQNYDSLIFENLIISVRENGIFQYILQYKPDTTWLLQNPNKLDLKTYSGIIRQFDIYRNFVIEVRLEHGVKVESYASDGRIKEICCSWDVWTSQTTGYSYLLIDCEDGSSYMLRVNDCGGGGGDSGGTGGGNGGGYTGGGDGGGYTGGSGGGDYYTGGGGGTSSGGYVGDPIGILVPADYEEDIILLDKPTLLLNDYLIEDPTALLEIDCNQLPKWQALTQHILSQSLVDKLKTYSSLPQHIVNAEGPLVNLDYFPVKVTTLPNKPGGGKYTAAEFLDYIRKNLNSFLDNDVSTFSPYNDLIERPIWESTNPLGALMRFDIPVGLGGLISQDGTVICSSYKTSDWIFTTVESPVDWNHPVSGHRQFGFETNRDGTYTFFARGVDRVTENFDLEMADFFATDTPFEGGDALWTSFQNKLQEFVNNPTNGGVSQKLSPVKNRPDWEKVKAVLQGSRPISDLGCK